MNILEQQAGNIVQEILKSRDADMTELNVKENIDSISIKIDSRLVCRIKFSGKKFYLSVSSRYSELFSGYNVYQINSDKDHIRIPLQNPNQLYDLADKFVQVYTDVLENVPVEIFGCCSFYLKCSDAKRCVDPDKEHAKGCIYRTRLEEGEIYYGKNRNID